MPRQDQQNEITHAFNNQARKTKLSREQKLKAFFDAEMTKKFEKSESRMNNASYRFEDQVILNFFDLFQHFLKLSFFCMGFDPIPDTQEPKKSIEKEDDNDQDKNLLKDNADQTRRKGAMKKSR